MNDYSAQNNTAQALNKIGNDTKKQQLKRYAFRQLRKTRLFQTCRPAIKN